IAPPRVEIVDHELHREVPSVLLGVEFGQQEAAFSDCVDRHVMAVEHLSETERVVEAFGRLKILRRQKRPRQFHTSCGDAHGALSVSRRTTRGLGSASCIQTKSCSVLVRAATTSALQFEFDTMPASNLYFSACALNTGNLAPKSTLPMLSLAL